MAITAEGMLRINGKTPGLPGPRRHPKAHLWSRAGGGLENTTGGGIKLCHFDQVGCTKLRFYMFYWQEMRVLSTKVLGIFETLVSKTTGPGDGRSPGLILCMNITWPLKHSNLRRSLLSSTLAPLIDTSEKTTLIYPLVN